MTKGMGAATDAGLCSEWASYRQKKRPAFPRGIGTAIICRSTISAVLEQRSGDYRMREYGFVLTLERKGKTLVATTPRGSSYTFRPLSAWKFIAQEDGAELHFDPENPDQIRLWGMHGQRQQSDKAR